MQLLCSSSEVGSDVRCPVCGQGFLLYWTRKSPQDQPVLVSFVMDALGRQHTTGVESDMGAGILSETHADSTLEALGGLVSSKNRLVDPQWGYC